MFFRKAVSKSLSEKATVDGEIAQCVLVMLCGFQALVRTLSQAFCRSESFLLHSRFSCCDLKFRRHDFVMILFLAIFKPS